MSGSLFNPTGKTDGNGDPTFEATPQARATDPVTSVEAAEGHKKSGRYRVGKNTAEWAVQHWPGRTAVELMFLIEQEWRMGRLPNHLSKLSRQEISRRLPDCREEGRVHNGEMRICEHNRTNMLTWLPGEGARFPKVEPKPKSDVVDELRTQVSDMRWAMREIRQWVVTGICGDNAATLKKIHEKCNEVIGDE